MGRRWRIRHKIVFPFFALLAFVGMVGTAAITAQASNATVSAFEGNLLRASLLSNDHLAILEGERLAQLRAAIDTQGVSVAVSTHATVTLSQLLRPIQVNAVPSQLILRVVDAKGDEVLTLMPPDGPLSLHGVDHLPVVQQVLQGQTDAQGDEYVLTRQEPSGTMVYWVGPIRSDPQTVVGAVLLGEALTEIAGGIRDSRASELTFYDQSGRILLSSLAGTPSLPASELSQLRSGPLRVSRSLGGHAYQFLIGPLRLRSTYLGYLAVALPADSLEASISHLRLLMAGLFGVAALMTLLVGSLLARRITRPIEQLVASTAAISAGELSHRAPVTSNDEIGLLAQSFNSMASSLEQKTRELEGNYFASIESLARAIDARDPYTFGHSTRVAAISMELADALGLSSDDRKALRRAALLHDIGKIGVEDRILRKPGPLTEEEWAAMRQHPMIGHKMLSGLIFLVPSLPGVLHHHERWDGGGYPDGLKGDAILPYIRILSVADTLDAKISDRPYRVGLPFEQAIAEIHNLAGIQFDRAVVEALLTRAEQFSILLMGKTMRTDTDAFQREKAS